MNRRSFLRLSPAFPAAAVTATLTVTEDGKPPIDLNVSVLKLQPGDTLVLTYQHPLSPEVCEVIRRHVEANFDGVKALLLDSDLKLEGVLRS